jgi:hypothetical protein
MVNVKDYNSGLVGFVVSCRFIVGFNGDRFRTTAARVAASDFPELLSHKNIYLINHGGRTGSGHNAVSGGEESAEDIFHEAATTTMDEEDAFHRQKHRGDRVHGRLLHSLEEEEEEVEEEEEEDKEDHAYDQWDPSSDPSHADDLYNENLDDEDDAYVYKNMHWGAQESITVVQHSQQETNNNTTTTTRMAASPQKKQLQMYKLQGTDVVLSCPCCFKIVCVDCQWHSKYSNQLVSCHFCHGHCRRLAQNSHLQSTSSPSLGSQSTATA